MTTTSPLSSPVTHNAEEYWDPVDAARHVTEMIDDRAVEAEADRTLPDDLVERLRERRLFSLMLPRALGGLECQPPTIIETIEVLSRADPSAGWTVLIGQGSGLLAWLDDTLAKDLLQQTPDPIVATGLAPLPGVTVTPEGDYGFSGRWRYSSGIRHSDWFLGAFSSPEHKLGSASGGPPPMRFALIPVAELEIVDTWRAMGLTGTGSHDVVATELCVSADRIIDPVHGAPVQHSPLYKLSFFTFLTVAMAGFPLGVARRALDEFEAIATRKSRSGSRTPLSEDSIVRGEVLQAESALYAARTAIFSAAEDVWYAAQAREQVDLDSRVRFAAAVQHALRVSVSVVDTSFQLVGGGAIYRSSPLQRCWRDIHAAAQHVVFGEERRRMLGDHLLGSAIPSAAV